VGAAPSEKGDSLKAQENTKTTPGNPFCGCPFIAKQPLDTPGHFGKPSATRLDKFSRRPTLGPMTMRDVVFAREAASSFKITLVTLLAVASVGLLLVGCATTPEQEAANRKNEEQKKQQKYASYTTPQLQLKRQEIAASIPAWYWGSGIAGAIQAGQIEGRKKDVAEIDRELLRRAESGDKTGQQKVSFILVSDPLGAKIESDGRFLGISPNLITFSGNVGATSTIRVTPATLDRPVMGLLGGVKEIDGRLAIDLASLGVVAFVFPNTPASKMGLEQGDKIVGINGISLPDVTGSKESAEAYLGLVREQLSRSGFGGEVSLKIIRGGKEQDLQGRTSEQLEGVYYVQEKVIQPMQFNNQVIMFDLRTQGGTPVALGGGSERASSPKGTTSTGTGFVVAEGGYVLTCQHVIGKSDEIEVREATGAKHKAKIIASDAGNDLCLLKADGLEVKPIPAAPPNSVSAGETIYCLGYPMEGVLENQNPVAGNGVVASLRGLKGDPRHLQITVPVNPGNSGGPVLDGHGRWVAVASHKLSDFYGLATTGQTPQGINFAVKGTLVVPLFDSIPEVKLPVSDTKDKISLEEAAKLISPSIVFITAKH
jgi:S1-C subfamily serine protease